MGSNPVSSSGMGTIAIIGGGAAGLAAAVRAGESLRGDDSTRVVLYEASDKVGRSILATGNGRCNLSNADVSASVYHNAAFVQNAFDALEVLEDETRAAFYGNEGNPVLRFFRTHGLLVREEGQGRLYPLANKASVVLDVLRYAAESAGVEFHVEARVHCVEPPRASGTPFTLRMADGTFERADRVIVACGGKVAGDLLPADLSYTEPVPMLCPLATEVQPVRRLDNIRVKCAIALERAGEVVAEEEGEVLFRKYGVSGIAVFDLSRFARAGDEIVIDLIPHRPRDGFGSELEDRAAVLARVYPKMTYGDLLRGMVHPLVADSVLEKCGLGEDMALDSRKIAGVAEALRSFRLKVEGVADPARCQVHRGGFAVEGFDPSTCAALDLPGLYVVGEALDVDGPCGGFNLHWAWATGLLAASAAVGSL